MSNDTLLITLAQPDPDQTESFHGYVGASTELAIDAGGEVSSRFGVRRLIGDVPAAVFEDPDYHANPSHHNHRGREMTIPKDVTLVEGAIHNPNEPRHFMRVVPAPGRQLATLAGQVVADSTEAVVVKEVGIDIYDAVVYFPRGGVAMAGLRLIDKTTHCPLKGDTEYFDIVAEDGSDHAEAAWSYIEMVAGDELRELIAFDPTKVRVTQTPEGQ